MKVKQMAVVGVGVISLSLGSAAFAQQAPDPSMQQPPQAGGQAGGQQMHDQETVRKVQEKLNEEGYSVGPTDGVWGPQTQQALTQFQQAEGIEATGQLDEQTMSALGIEEEAGAAGAQEAPKSEGAGAPAPQEGAGQKQ